MVLSYKNSDDFHTRSFRFLKIGCLIKSVKFYPLFVPTVRAHSSSTVSENFLILTHEVPEVYTHVLSGHMYWVNNKYTEKRRIVRLTGIR